MATYRYVSINQFGQTKKGVLEGENIQHINQQLRDKGLTPIEIFSANRRNFFSFNLFQPSKVTTSRLATFTFQLGILLSSGLPLEASLTNIIEQTDLPFFKNILLSVRAKLLEGFALADAMNAYPKVFPELYRATISAGEQSGHLDEVVDRLSIYLEQQESIKQRVRQALIYPALLSLVSLGIIYYLLTFAMPKITSVFTENGQALPQLTLTLLTISAFFKTYGIYILLIFIAAIFFFRRKMREASFKFKVHQVILRLPIIRQTIIIINATRFMRTFGILFGASVPAIEAMEIANSTVSLLPMRKAIESSIVQVGEGVNLNQALLQTGYFSRLSTQLIHSGETSGQLQLMLEKSAQYQEQILLKWITTALSLFEPALILTMGMFVLFIVLAIMLPIFQMNEFLG